MLEEKRQLIEPQNSQLTIAKQCELLGLARSSFYYQKAEVSEENLILMRLIDEQYLKTPFYGVPRLTVWLRQQGYLVNHKRVARLMRVMGLMAIYPKPHTSLKAHKAQLYPYLLRGKVINQVNQVWSADITYIPMAKGFIYLVAIMDWFSRYVLSWSVSVTMEVDFCLEALEKALKLNQPQIFNTDQGAQFTSTLFTGLLHHHQIAISMDGRGRAFDNIFIERLWRSLKYEDVYLKNYTGVADAIANIRTYFLFYNNVRPHQSLNYLTPQQLYFGLVPSSAVELALKPRS